MSDSSFHQKWMPRIGIKQWKGNIYECVSGEEEMLLLTATTIVLVGVGLAMCIQLLLLWNLQTKHIVSLQNNIHSPVL